jgi:adenylylsulfate kinase
VEGKTIVWHQASVSKAERQALNGHKSCILWFTGLSGSGKSTLANALAKALHQRQVRTFVLDGDNIRHGLNKDLGFSPEDRTENIRRIGEVAKLFVEAGIVTLTAFISPFRADREQVRAMVEEGEFIEVYVKCDLQTCEQRDPKGLYRKARAGQIPEFTGISSPYEEPLQPEITVDTSVLSVQEAVDLLLVELLKRSVIPGQEV